MAELPSISAVIIGINVGKTLQGSIESILQADYPQDLIEIIYVDGGSTDQSIEIASSFSQVKVIELNDPHPTPGKGRNAGLNASQHPFILFLDGDTILHSQFLMNAITAFKTTIGAVVGNRIEVNPNKNIYHLIANIEWKNLSGDVLAFGGDVLIRREVIESCSGYDNHLVAGEDPDLSYRIRQKGWKILALPIEMTKHDIAMDKFSQYAKRAVRSGYAFAEVYFRYRDGDEKFWKGEHDRILFGTLVPIAFLVASISLGIPLIGFLLFFLFIFRAIRKIPQFRREYELNLLEGFIYSTHLALVPYIQLIGVARFHLSRIKIVPPLKNSSPRYRNLG
jgi:glycosyltransferase involved in cell wall biosynthesis